MELENIKQAFDKFIDKDYETSKNIITKEFDKEINNYFKRELNLKNDIYKNDDEE